MIDHDPLSVLTYEQIKHLHDRMMRGAMKAGQVRVVVNVLKETYPDLKTEQHVDTAMKILQALEKNEEKRT